MMVTVLFTYEGETFVVIYFIMKSVQCVLQCYICLVLFSYCIKTIKTLQNNQKIQIVDLEF